MDKVIKYPVLEGQIAARGIRKTVIAKRIGCSTRALSNKLSGRSRFDWDEVTAMRMTFFPDVSSEDLMRTEG